jgi:hypothetical protein
MRVYHGRSSVLLASTFFSFSFFSFPYFLMAQTLVPLGCVLQLVKIGYPCWISPKSVFVQQITNGCTGRVLFSLGVFSSVVRFVI